MMGLEVGGMKLLMSILLILTNFITGCVTRFLVKNASARWTRRAHTIASCLTGGLFLGLVFFVLVPESFEHLQEIENKHDKEFNLYITEISMAFGYIMMFIIDVITTKFARTDLSLQDCELQSLHSVSPQTTTSTTTTTSPCRSSFAFYLMFTVLLSAHSFFEGLPIGYKQELGPLHAFFWPIMIHKVLEAISLAFVGLKERNALALLGSLFHSCMTPAGTLVGHYLVKSSTSLVMELFVHVVIAVSIGTFVYITCSNVIPDIKNDDNEEVDKFSQVNLLLAGLIVTVFISAVIKRLEK